MARKDSLLAQTMLSEGIPATKRMIIAAWKETGTTEGAAESLGISQGTLGYYMRICGLEIRRYIVEINPSLPKEAEVSHG
jgi:hypothetical protein